MEYPYYNRISFLRQQLVLKKGLLCLSLLRQKTYAQVLKALVDFQGIKTNALVLDVDYPKDTVEKAVDELMKTKCFQGEKKSGVGVYRQIVLSTISGNSMDVYTMVARKGHEEKNKSTIYLIVSSQGNSCVSNLDNTPLMENALVFLNVMQESVKGYIARRQIKEYEEALEKCSMIH